MAKKLTEAGAFVVGTATSEKGAETVSAALGEKGRGIVLNVTDRAACAEAVNAVVTEFGRIDILVNNAGITRDMLAMRLSDEDWDAVIATNLTSVFTMTRACLRPMIKARYGRIINMSSVVAQMGNAGQANYAAAKAGIIGMSKSVAQEVASRGITVNCIAPGYMDTEMNTALTDPSNPRYQEITDRIPAHRWGTPDDMKGTAIFLSSHASDYLNGAVIPVDGGYLVK